MEHKMNILPKTLKHTFLLAGAVAFFALPSYGQLPEKILPAAKTALQPAFKVPLAQKIAVPGGLRQNFGPAVSVYTARPIPTPEPPIIPKVFIARFYPLTDSRTTLVQGLLRKKLAKPAPTFYEMFKQAVYLHQKNPSAFKKVSQRYYYEMTLFLKHAAHVTQQAGYPAVAAYLKEHKGDFPTLHSGGTLSANDRSARMLTFYASEEMNTLMNQILSRPAEKQIITDDEWVAINVLSTLFPAQTRPAFYNFLLDKQYKELQILSLDPYMHNSDTRRLVQGTIDPQSVHAPSLAKRISSRERYLQYLTQRKAALPGTISHKRQQYAKNQVIYDILSAEGETAPSAIQAKNALDKSYREYTQASLQLKEISAKIEQVTDELNFLRTK